MSVSSQSWKTHDQKRLQKSRARFKRNRPIRRWKSDVFSSVTTSQPEQKKNETNDLGFQVVKPHQSHHGSAGVRFPSEPPGAAGTEGQTSSQSLRPPPEAAAQVNPKIGWSSDRNWQPVSLPVAPSSIPRLLRRSQPALMWQPLWN